MSEQTSLQTSCSNSGPAKKLRCQSASQIAKNKDSFVVWSEHQNLEDASLSDLPEDIRSDALAIFDVQYQLPLAWIGELDGAGVRINAILPADFEAFLRGANSSAPELFSLKQRPEDQWAKNLLSELQIVFSGWKKLVRMGTSSRKWSEADYAANLYNVIRSPGIQEAEFRAQCPVALPQPLPLYGPRVTPGDVRILNAKTACPDGSVFVPKRALVGLMEKSNSPFNRLKKATKGTLSPSGRIGGKSGFRYQATLCTTLSDGGGFEFVSSFWEDKKHEHIDAACRQNRMATASAVRQLHALRIRAPIFGLVWAQGTVRAHVDWWDEIEVVDDSGRKVTVPVVRSAPYGGCTGGPKKRRTSRLFHEWDLKKPSDILRVYLLIKNINCWTVTGFVECIDRGIRDLQKSVLDGTHTLVPWKRNGNITVAGEDEPADSTKGRRTAKSATPTDTPPKRRRKRAPRSS